MFSKSSYLTSYLKNTGSRTEPWGTLHVINVWLRRDTIGNKKSLPARSVLKSVNKKCAWIWLYYRMTGRVIKSNITSVLNTYMYCFRIKYSGFCCQRDSALRDFPVQKKLHTHTNTHHGVTALWPPVCDRIFSECPFKTFVIGVWKAFFSKQ